MRKSRKDQTEKAWGFWLRFEVEGMYNNVLQGITGLINVIGTVYAVLSIIRIKVEDLYNKITLDGMDKMDMDALEQREQARTGIALVIAGWALQFIFNFINIIDCCSFLVCIFVVFCITLLLILIIHNSNIKFRKRYEEYSKGNSSIKDSHADSHSWKEF